MQIYNFVMAAVMYVISGIMFWQMKGIDAPDSRILPTVVAVILIVLSTVLVVEQLIKMKKNQAENYDFKNTSRGMAVVLILLVFAICAELFGFFVCTPFFIFFTMLFLGQRNKAGVILVPVIATAVVVVVFRLIFQVPFPEGTVFNIFNLF